MESIRYPFRSEETVGNSDGGGNALPCKMGTKKRSNRLRQTACETTEHNKKTKHACIVEAHESRRKRLESTPLKDHEDHIVEKRFNSIWCTSLFRCPKR